jgi:hypothetical protein
VPVSVSVLLTVKVLESAMLNVVPVLGDTVIPLRDLLERASMPARVASVPLVGSVSAVVAETVKVVPNAPEIVSVDEALLATPVPPRTGDRLPVQPSVRDAARRSAVVGVPAMVAHAGAADALPLPVWLRYCFAVVMLPASFESVFAADAYRVSPVA